MPAAPDPDLAIRAAKATVDLYSRATETMLGHVARRVARGIDQPGWAERKLAETAALRDRAVAELDRLMSGAPAAVQEAIRTGWAAGQTDAVREIGGAMTVRTNTVAVDALVRETVGRVTSTHPQILRSTLDAYRDVIAETSAVDVLTGTRTRVQAAQQALDRFAQQGITGYRDRRGRAWTLDSYTEMATRTAVGRAQVAGALDRYAADGRDLVIVSDAPEECSVCLVPGTLVEGPIATGAARLEYSGDVVRIVTASGNHLTGTPDHAVLTPHGWRRLQDLHPGDQVIRDLGEHRVSGVVPQHVQVPALIEEAGEPGAPVLLAGPTRRDLHQGRAYREVRAVLTHDDLLTERLPPLSQPLSEQGLVLGLGPLLRGDLLTDLGGGLDPAAGCLMCAVEHGGPLLGSGFGPSAFHGGGAACAQFLGREGIEASLEPVVAGPRLDTSPAQVVADHPTADAEGGAQLLRALAGDVALDEVVSVGWRQFRGHVWDLSTRPGWFLANGIVTHNCRPWEGQVLSISGATPQGTEVTGGEGATFTVAGTVAEAQAAGLHHPNCRHRLGAFVPGLTRRMADTADPEGDRARQEQRRLERGVRAWRRREAAAITPEAKAAAGRHRRAWQDRLRGHVDARGLKRQYHRER